MAGARAEETRDKEGGHLERRGEMRQERRGEMRQERREEMRQERRGRPREEIAGRADEQIIADVRSGDTRQFRELVERYQDAVYGMARRFVESPQDAEDIAQEAFLRVHRGLERFKGEARFSTWLYRITYNLCADWLRSHRKPGRVNVAIEDTGAVEDTAAGFEQSLLDEEEREHVRGAVEELDEKYRTVIILLYYQQLSYEQIAEVLGVPMKTVETRLYRARRTLRERLAVTEQHHGSRPRREGAAPRQGGGP